MFQVAPYTKIPQLAGIMCYVNSSTKTKFRQKVWNLAKLEKCLRRDGNTDKWAGSNRELPEQRMSLKLRNVWPRHSWQQQQLAVLFPKKHDKHAQKQRRWLMQSLTVDLLQLWAGSEASARLWQWCLPQREGTELATTHWRERISWVILLN